MTTVLVAMIRLYQRWISPAFPARCRFYPSCSAYAVTSLRRHGLLRGVVLSVTRLARCHPWNPGGVDRVPPAPRHAHCSPAIHTSAIHPTVQGVLS